MVGRPRVTETTTGDISDNDSASESGGESHGNISRKRHTSPAAGSVEERLPLSDRRVLTSLTPDRFLLPIIPVGRYGSLSSLAPTERARFRLSSNFTEWSNCSGGSNCMHNF